MDELTAIAATCIREGSLRSLWAKAVNDPAMKGCDTSVTLILLTLLLKRKWILLTLVLSIIASNIVVVI